MSDPTSLTDTEKALQRVLTAGRVDGYGNQKPYIRPKDATVLGYLFADAHRGGRVYSPFGQFKADMMVEWAIRVLNYLTEQRVEMPRTAPAFEWEDGWDKAKPEIERIFAAKFNADRDELQGEYDEDPDGFRGWNTTAVVVDGKVTDPWGYSYVASCRWFLDHMSAYSVFTVWQVVNDAVTECAAEYLGLWAEGGNEGDPRKVAEKALQAAMRNLDDHIDTELKATIAA